MPRGLRDGGLNVLRGGVNVPFQGELDGDLRDAERADRSHRVDARDGGELTFERRGHGRSHGLRTGAGQVRLYENGRIINAG